MADASSTSVNMSEDSEDDDYGELEGVELYKGGSSVADDHEAMEDAAQAAVTPNLGSAAVCPHREVICRHFSVQIQIVYQMICPAGIARHGGTLGLCRVSR